MSGRQIRPMTALARHELRAGAPGLAGQAFIVAVAGGMLSLLFSVLRLSQAGVGMPDNARFLATNAVLWIIGSCVVILPQVGRFGIDRRRYEYACWSIAGVSFVRTVGVIGLGVAVSAVAGVFGGLVLALLAAPLLARLPVMVQDERVFVPGVSLAPALSDYVSGFAIVLLLVVLSSLLGAWRISRTPPRLALAEVAREPRRSVVRRVVASTQGWLILALVCVGSGWLFAGEQSGLFTSVAAILLLVWLAGVVRAGWIRQVQRLVIGVFRGRPLAFGSSGLATESLRVDPIVLYPILFTMGAPAIIVSVVNAETVVRRFESTMTMSDIVVLFFGPLVLALATAVVGLWLGASALGRTIDHLGVLGFPRRSCLVAAAVSQVYLVMLSLVLVVTACLVGVVLQALIVGGGVGDVAAVLLQGPPYGYLLVAFVVIVVPSALISAVAHAARTPSDGRLVPVA